MEISTLKAGDEVYVFSRHRDRYVKLTVRVGAAGIKFVEIPNSHAWRRVDTVELAEGVDAVTAEELPAAKKRHAERRKAAKAAEVEREKRVSGATWFAGELHALGVSLAQYGKLVRPAVDYDGMIRVDLTLEQARALLDALKGKG